MLSILELLLIVKEFDLPTNLSLFFFFGRAAQHLSSLIGDQTGILGNGNVES